MSTFKSFGAKPYLFTMPAYMIGTAWHEGLPLLKK